MTISNQKWRAKISRENRYLMLQDFIDNLSIYMYIYYRFFTDTYVYAIAFINIENRDVCFHLVINLYCSGSVFTVDRK
jgi:hypothetical protein